VLGRVAALLPEFSFSEYVIDDRLSRFRWIPEGFMRDFFLIKPSSGIWRRFIRKISTGNVTSQPHAL
jgi:hypothetical protein